jgi:hypothetical protein
MPRHCDFTPNSCAELHKVSILVTKTENRVTNLETWQDRQNGSLANIDSRLNKVQWYVIGTLTSSVVSLLAIILGYLLQRLS